jgi:leader peptidase (prepilin peptidase)/N-methyltransferase
LTRFTISDSAAVSLAFLAIGARWGQAADAGGAPLDTALALTVDMLLPGGSLFLLRECFFRWKGYDGLGLGDVKLALAGGAVAGAVGFCWALFAASALALAFTGLKAVWCRPISGHERIAFGAALAPAVWTVWVMEQWPLLIPAGSL